VTALRVLSVIGGCVTIAVTSMSVLATLVVPRGIGSRISIFVGRRTVRGLFLFVARRADEYETKDRILALAAPIALLTTFAVWLLLYLLAYGLIIWGLAAGSFADALRESGSSLFTLGVASSPRAGPIATEFAAAATGLLVVALEIAYLPTIYGAFNRRETLVTMLESRAGTPAWGPEILVRHHLVGIVDNLPALYADWERWAADVDESHTSHTVVVSFRSPHPMRSWVVALLAVLDSAALYNALSPERAPSEARLCLRMGFTCMRDIATAFGLKFNGDPLPTDPIDLTFEEFRFAVERLQEVDFPMERTAEEAWPDFKGWRVNYESLAYALADQTVAVPAPWSGPRTHVPGRFDPVRPTDRRPDDVEGKRAAYKRPPLPRG
jgi:hypothetical protein